MTSESPGVLWKLHDGGKRVTVKVDSGAVRNRFDDQLIPELKRRLLNHVIHTLPRKILASGGYQLDGTAEGHLQGFSPTNTVINILS